MASLLPSAAAPSLKPNTKSPRSCSRRLLQRRLMGRPQCWCVMASACAALWARRIPSARKRRKLFVLSKSVASIRWCWLEITLKLLSAYRKSLGWMRCMPAYCLRKSGNCWLNCAKKSAQPAWLATAATTAQHWLAQMWALAWGVRATRTCSKRRMWSWWTTT